MAKEKAMEEAAWYNNDFQKSRAGRRGRNNTYTDPENVYDLDDTHLVKSNRAKPT